MPNKSLFVAAAEQLPELGEKFAALQTKLAGLPVPAQVLESKMASDVAPVDVLGAGLARFNVPTA